MNRDKRWREITALFLIALAVFGVADDFYKREQNFHEVQGQITDADMQLSFAQRDRDSEEIAEQETESGAASEQETDSGDNIAAASGFPIITHLTGINGDIDSMISSDDVYYVSVDEQYFYVTQEGEKLTNDEYEKAYPFNEGLACVCKNGKYGFLDKEGRYGIPFQYDDAGPFVEGLAYFSIGEEYGFMDQTGTPAFYLDCDSVSNFQEGLAYICTDGRYGYIDQNGGIVIEPVYQDADYFQNGFAKVMKNGKFGIIDKTGQEIVELKYQQIERYEDSVIGFYNEVLGECGYLCNGNVVKFKENYEFKDFIPERKLIVLKLGERWGIIDFDGNIKVPFEYGFIRYDKDSSVFIVRDKEEKKGILSAEDFTWKVSCIYDSIDYFVNGKAVVEVGEKYGVIDADGNIDMPVSYDRIGLFENGGYWYKQGETSYLFDADGKLLDEGNYAGISYEKNCYWVSKKGSRLFTVGFLDLSGKVILSPKYDLVQYHDFGEPGIELLSGHGNIVVKMEDKEREELPRALQYNKLTPRVSEYLDFLKNGTFFVEDMSSSGHETSLSEWTGYEIITRLYDFGQLGKPALYLYGSPEGGGFGTSTHSGFFACQGREVVCLASGYNGGGSAGGDSVSLWYDEEEEKLLPGRWGSYTATEIYDLIDGKCSPKVSFDIFEKSPGPEGGEFIKSYYVNGEKTTEERYKDVRKRYVWVDFTD